VILTPEHRILEQPLHFRDKSLASMGLRYDSDRGSSQLKIELFSKKAEFQETESKFKL
jgi:hypothetical protein